MKINQLYQNCLTPYKETCFEACLKVLSIIITKNACFIKQNLQNYE